jgi:hypothetical protein
MRPPSERTIPTRNTLKSKILFSKLLRKASAHELAREYARTDDSGRARRPQAVRKFRANRQPRRWCCRVVYGEQTTAVAALLRASKFDVWFGTAACCDVQKKSAAG